MLKRLSLDTIISLILMAAGVYWLRLCSQLPEDMVVSQYSKPSTFPSILAAAIVVLSAAVVIRNVFFIKDDYRKKPFNKRSAIRVLLMIALCALYISVIRSAGYLITTILFLVGSLLLFGERKPVTVILVSILVPISLYVLFYYFLQVRLP